MRCTSPRESPSSCAAASRRSRRNCSSRCHGRALGAVRLEVLRTRRAVRDGREVVRDLAVVPMGAGGSTACLLTILPNLPAWLRRSRRTGATEPGLFRLGAPLDELAFDRLTLGGGARDPLGAALRDPSIRSRFGPGAESEALERVAVAFDEVRDEIAALQPTGPRRGCRPPRVRRRPSAHARTRRRCVGRCVRRGGSGGDHERPAHPRRRAEPDRGRAPRRSHTAPSFPDRRRPTHGVRRRPGRTRRPLRPLDPRRFAATGGLEGRRLHEHHEHGAPHRSSPG